jgi:acid phosphatase (class A)
MNGRLLYAVVCFTALILSGAVSAQAPQAPRTPDGPDGAAPERLRAPSARSDGRDTPPPRRPAGYLGAAGVLDEALFLPPPPAPDSPLGIADVQIFHATRSLENSDRWRLAAADARIDRASVIADFGCALGTDLSEQETPELSELLARAMADLGPIIGEAKARYRRPRPFLAEHGPVCVTPSDRLAASGSYPSGHAATGWLYALIFAQVEPERSAELLARGRVYGESRVVCGVHYPSDVDAGRTVSTGLVTALSANPEFRADVREARAEIEALRADGAAAPEGRRCSIEQSAAGRPW